MQSCVCCRAKPRSATCTSAPVSFSSKANIGLGSRQQVLSTCCCTAAKANWKRFGCLQAVCYCRWTGRSIRQKFQLVPWQQLHAPQAPAAGWRQCMTAIRGSSASADVPLPADKLSPSLPLDVDQKPMVLVNCGSFNPPTIMHLCMFDVAAQVLRKVTYNQMVFLDPEKHAQPVQQDSRLLCQERCLSPFALAKDMIIAMLCVVEDVVLPKYPCKHVVMTTCLTFAGRPCRPRWVCISSQRCLPQAWSTSLPASHCHVSAGSC